MSVCKADTVTERAKGDAPPGLNQPFEDWYYSTGCVRGSWALVPTCRALRRPGLNENPT